MDFTDSISEQFLMKIYDTYLTTPKTCGYTTLEIIVFKNCVDEAQ